MKCNSILRRAALFLYGRICHPKTTGVRAIVLDETGTRILLVKHTYITGWYLPGGKVEKKETILEAFSRELQEELGLVPNESRLFGVYESCAEGKRDTIVVLICKGVFGMPTQHGEIAEACFFEMSALPRDLSPGTRRRIEELRQGKNPVISQW